MKTVAIVTMKGCHPCGVLKTFLRKNGIQFQEFDHEEKKALARKGVPVLIVNGVSCVGGDERDWRKLLGI
jgi:glutaredoxin